MKGLKEYIKKHGKHFTEQLAYDVAFSKRWRRKQIEIAIQDRVWYNVTGSTMGDIVYLVNECYNKRYDRRTKCITYTLLYIGDFKNYGGKLFDGWLKEVEDFDFTSYV